MEVFTPSSFSFSLAGSPLVRSPVVLSTCRVIIGFSSLFRRPPRPSAQPEHPGPLVGPSSQRAFHPKKSFYLFRCSIRCPPGGHLFPTPSPTISSLMAGIRPPPLSFPSSAPTALSTFSSFTPALGSLRLKHFFQVFRPLLPLLACPSSYSAPLFQC